MLVAGVASSPSKVSIASPPKGLHMPSSSEPTTPRPVPSKAAQIKASGDHALARIKTALIEKKMTQAELADAADCHEKTIQNLLAGKAVRQQTLFDVCMVLGLDYDAMREAWGQDLGAAAAGRQPPRLDLNGAANGHGTSPGDVPRGGHGGNVAPLYMGAYSREGVDHYVGSYLTLRPSFSAKNRIVAYRTDISWDGDWPSLLFQETDRPDAPYSHRGRLYVPPSSSFIHLVSLTKGAMRMVVVSQLDATGHMRGLITTLTKQKSQFVPVSAPVVYVRTDDFFGVKLGDVEPKDAAFAGYVAALREGVEHDYARLISVADPAAT
jgi:DNA-binding Xre family transcriptional regulator